MGLPKSAELFFGLHLTEEQKIYADSIVDNLFTGVQARAGSGKTTVAIGVAKIIGKPTHYIFPTVQEKALGYTTGDQRDKESKYLTPLLDALVEIGENPMRAIVQPMAEKQKSEPEELYDKLRTKKNKHKVVNPKFVEIREGDPWVHAYSHNFMRGGNIKDSTVIIDEAQNLTKIELRTILTRIHDSCHVVLMGDYLQCDIDPRKSGFMPYLAHYETESYAQVCELTKNFRGRISAHAETLA